MPCTVLDASALLALLNQETGYEQVTQAVTDGAAISTINLSEVVAKLSEAAIPENVIHEILDFLGLEIIDFDAAFAYQSGLLRPSTRHAGLSFGDRACLALAQYLGLPAITADKAWKDVALGITIQVLR